MITTPWISRSLVRFLLLLLCASCCATTPVEFDPRESTIQDVTSALYSGRFTCREITLSFLARIQALNHNINSIIALNPRCLDRADELDRKIASGNVSRSKSPLLCVPVLLKDNFDTKDMLTTGGCLDLAHSQPLEDAPAVQVLVAAGAVILGKTNLHELALEGLTVSSLGGQTINPYDFDRTPGGSSGGSAAALAASFAVIATGTDTVNSLRSPASANSLVSVRPTRGLISRNGIIPISYTQDTIGPIARTIDDLRIALEVMASIGYDPMDNATALRPLETLKNSNFASMRENVLSYEAQFIEEATGSETEPGSQRRLPLTGIKLGVLEGFFNRTATNETTPVNEAMDQAIVSLEKLGARVINITDSVYNASSILADLDTQRFEYREMLTGYLQKSFVAGQHPRTMPELYSSNNFLVIPSQYEYVKTALVSSTSNATYEHVQRGIWNLTLSVQQTMARYGLAALIYPEQKNLVVKIGSASQSGRNGILAALTGSPVVTVPIGFSPQTPSAPVGVPIGMEILGRPWSENDLLDIADAFTQKARVRRPPTFAQVAVQVGALDAVPNVGPDRGDIPAAYPLGRL